MPRVLTIRGMPRWAASSRVDGCAVAKYRCRARVWLSEPVQGFGHIPKPPNGGMSRQQIGIADRLVRCPKCNLDARIRQRFGQLGYPKMRGPPYAGSKLAAQQKLSCNVSRVRKTRLLPTPPPKGQRQTRATQTKRLCKRRSILTVSKESGYKQNPSTRYPTLSDLPTGPLPVLFGVPPYCTSSSRC